MYQCVQGLKVRHELEDYDFCKHYPFGVALERNEMYEFPIIHTRLGRHGMGHNPAVGFCITNAVYKS